MRTPGQQALLRLKLARCAYEVAKTEYRCWHACGGGTTYFGAGKYAKPRSKRNLALADRELAAALKAFEALS